jgi:hypothetical protein
VRERSASEALFERLRELHLRGGDDAPLARARLAMDALDDAEEVRRLLCEVRDEAIREAATAGHTTALIMHRTGLSRSHVQKVRHRKTTPGRGAA